MKLFHLSDRVAIVTGSSRGNGKAIAARMCEHLARVANLLPLRRIGDPEDIAGAAVFLASQAAAFLTWQVLNADGGNAVV